MNNQTTIGTACIFNQSFINAAARAFGVAKTGTAIGSLYGAAYTNATAAWIGFGSMKVGMFMTNALPIVGGLLILDSLCGTDHGAPLIDWYEESWKEYEAMCELEELKKTVKVDPDHRVIVTKQPSSLAQQEDLFRKLEIEHELYLLKKSMRREKLIKKKLMKKENEINLLKKELELL